MVLVAGALALITGCGGGSSDSGSGGSSTGPEAAGFAAPGSVVYVEGDLRPTGQLKTDADAAAKKLVGEDFGQFLVSKLEEAAGDEGKPLDFASEVEPWLGKTAGVSFARLQDKGGLSEPVIAIQTTEPQEAQRFIDKRAGESSKPYKAGAYKGIKFQVGGAEGNAIGVVGEWVLLAGGEKEFKAAVDAWEGDSLADEARFADAFAAATSGSIADVYADVGAIVEQSGENLNPQVQAALESSDVDTGDVTAVASVIPGSERIQIDVSSDLGEKPPKGDASKLLGSLPADSDGAFGLVGFAEQFEEAIDNLDENGSPPRLKPGELKSELSNGGVDIDAISASLDEAALFVEGNTEANLGVALVVTAHNEEAVQAVAGLGGLLRGADVPGVTVLNGQASGFSIRNDETGGKALVVAGKDKRIAIGYGLRAALRGLGAGSGPTLSGTTGYKQAVAALGKAPISAYVDGPAALRLAEALVPSEEKDFWEAVPYLKKITFLAAGSGTDGELATAKVIAGLPK